MKEIEEWNDYGVGFFDPFKVLKRLRNRQGFKVRHIPPGNDPITNEWRESYVKINCENDLAVIELFDTSRGNKDYTSLQMHTTDSRYIKDIPMSLTKTINFASAMLTFYLKYKKQGVKVLPLESYGEELKKREDYDRIVKFCEDY